MSAMGIVLIAASCAAQTAAERPPEPPPRYWWYATTLGGLGATGAATGRNAVMTLTAEVGERPFAGAISTGMSVSSSTDVKGLLSVITPGIFAKFDLTYPFASGLWSHAPVAFPLRVLLGLRVGLGVSQSYEQTQPNPDGYVSKTSYVLMRPELEPTLDLAFPIGRDQVYAFVLRGAIDTPMTLNDVFRWSVSLGLSVSWDPIAP